MDFDNKLIEQTLTQMLEFKIRTTALNKNILLIGGQNPRDVLLLSFLTTIPFDIETVQIIENIMNGPHFHRLESHCISEFGFAFSNLLVEYTNTIIIAYKAASSEEDDDVEELHEQPFVDMSLFFEQTAKAC